MSKKNTTAEILSDLFSGDDKRLNNALSNIQEHPSLAFIQPLMALYFETSNEEMKEKLRDMLGSIKVKGFEEELMIALRNPEWSTHRGQILAFMWNAGGNPVLHVKEIIELSLTGGMETLLECYSVLETMEGPMTEEQLIESQTFLHETHKKMEEGHSKQLVAMLSNVLAEKEIED
jgi:hypothetical protein